VALEATARSLERATAELREANQQLLSLDHMKDDFMSSVTHELRTPLTSIRALSELMRDDVDMAPAQRQQFLEIIVGETERLTRLVNQVLDLAKIEAGHAEWHEEMVDIPVLAQQAVDSLRENYREAGVSLVVRCNDGIPSVWADADRLMQVVLNLLSNALKYAPDGTGEVVVSVQTAPEGVVLEVQDNGPGIAADQEAVVFEKFHQVAGDAHYRPGGTGLGLPISRQIVEHFGGRMWLRSSPGMGACFGFLIPHCKAGGPTGVGEPDDNEQRRAQT
jgi:signal transduction histidine kinase